ncbi:tyrosine-type recombinase/integrase [Methylolobus aquaticus]
MLYKQKGSARWWMRFRTPDGREIRESTGTTDRTLAEEYEARRKMEIYRVAKLGDRPRRTWKEAVVRWLEETTKRTLRDDVSMFRRLDRHFGDCFLDQIGPDKIRELIRSMREEGLTPARVNRVLCLVRAVLRKSEREWEWIDRAPVVKMLPVENRRLRWLTRDEAQRLIEECPPHLAAMVRFALATGLREANVTKLEWSQVDLERRVMWVHPDQAKGKKAIGIPLNRDAMVVLREQQGKHSTRVFTYEGRPIEKANAAAFPKACRRAGLTDICWHSLRHTWASWMTQAGVPLDKIQLLGGWSNLAMVQRYAHLAPEHLAEHAEAVSWAVRIETGIVGTGENRKAG